MVSNLIKSLSPSPTLTLDAKVKALQANGEKIINLCLGEPDFDTPKHIQKSALKAMQDGFTHYTVTAGILELREAIVKKFTTENGIEYEANQIIVGMGSKPLLYLTFQTILNPGDEVLVPVPTWNTFVEQIKLTGAKPKLIKLQPPFKLTASEVEQQITKKTKLLLLNSPANPTGAMIDKKELKKIAELIVKHNIYVLADEIYEKITYGEKHVSIASLNKKTRDLTITTNGFSKSYAMTGWRIGYAGGPRDIISGMVSLQGQLTSNVVSFVQKAGITALNDEQSSITKMVREFAKRRKFVINELKKIPDLSWKEPEGAFYFFISVENLLGKEYSTSEQWCSNLLEKHKVAVVPGEAFFFPGYFRLSFAASMEEISQGLQGIKKFILES